MIEQVNKGGGEAGGAHCANANGHIAKLGNGRLRKEFFQIGFQNGGQRADKSPGNAQRQHQQSDRIGKAREINTEHAEHQTDKHID